MVYQQDSVIFVLRIYFLLLFINMWKFDDNITLGKNQTIHIYNCIL
jgi:hypothetical protein